MIRLSAPGVPACPVFARHRTRCERSTDEERAFYRAHRRWPQVRRRAAWLLPGGNRGVTNV